MTGKGLMKIINVVGARPNFMKIAPIYEELRKYPEVFKIILLHTGQHYDQMLSDSFFEDLKIPKPNIYLGVGSGSHAQQTAKILVKFEKVLFGERPDLVLVVGDVNSTLACSLAAAKLHIPVAHVEAGLRSFDREMPEEINRVLTDHLADFLFTTCLDANENLRNEGIEDKKIHLVGDVMIDTLIKYKDIAKRRSILKRLALKRKDYALLTLHRPSNVDDKKALADILDALEEVQKRIKIIFPIHPRTKKQIKKFNFESYFNFLNSRFTICDSKINCLEPLGYIDFLQLMSNAKLVLTDSGGMQEETTYLKIPCLTLRENTERPVTIKEGTNILVGRDNKKIIKESFNILDGKKRQGKRLKLWDGKASKRIVKVLARSANNRRTRVFT